MVDKRLEQMHTSQMTESTVNLEMVEALKKHGPNVVFVIALILVGIRGWIWWQETRTKSIGQAWVEQSQIDSYGSMAGFVNQYENIGSVSDIASLSAASFRLYELYEDVSPSWVPSEPDPEAAFPQETEVAPPMTPEERATALDEVEAQYRRVLDRTQGTPGKELLTAKALFGLASVAEMRQDLKSATAFYQQAQSTIPDDYEDLKTLCQTRIDSLDADKEWTPLPTSSEIAQVNAPPTPEAESNLIGPLPSDQPDNRTEGDPATDEAAQPDTGEALQEDPAQTTESDPGDGGGDGGGG